MKMDKIITLIKNKDYIIPRILFDNYHKLNITGDEFILLIYLYNAGDMINFDCDHLIKATNLDKKQVLELISALTDKQLIEIKIIKNEDGIINEFISLEPLYTKMGLMLIDDNANCDHKDNLFSLFEKEFGRTLSPMEYEIISGWLKEKFDQSMILEALKEAVYNGVTNLRYIDKILYEWHKKGFKSLNDVKQHNHNFRSNKNSNNDKNKELFSYDWLDGNE